jgi:hypothetical protein
VEVFNLETGEHLKTLTTFKTPHAFFLVPGTHRLIVTDDSGPRVIDDRTYQVPGKIDVAAGADTEYYDASGWRGAYKPRRTVPGSPKRSGAKVLGLVSRCLAHASLREISSLIQRANACRG